MILKNKTKSGVNWEYSRSRNKKYRVLCPECLKKRLVKTLPRRGDGKCKACQKVARAVKDSKIIAKKKVVRRYDCATYSDCLTKSAIKNVGLNCIGCGRYIEDKLYLFT